jgi:putative phosphoribosyl transferase
MNNAVPSIRERLEVEIPAGNVRLEGELTIPDEATGVVLFAHGSGSSRHSPRNQHVAEIIRGGRIATLLFDLLTREEESVDIYTRHLRFDIELLADRLAAATSWLISSPAADLAVGYFGASTGGGAALVAAAKFGPKVAAVVSRGGRPDLAGDALPKVTAPTLLLVGEFDELVIEMNEAALAKLNCEKKLRIIPGATHLFEEPGTLDQVARSATDWFETYLQPIKRSAAG